MISKEHVLLAPFTTFHIGGPARFFVEAHTEKDIEDAVAFSHKHHLPLLPLGAGSNVLVPNEGVEGIVLHVALSDIVFEKEGDDTLLIAGAGAVWDTVVDAVGALGLFGIENLAGIPGTLGGAVVQNIGAYGAEFAAVFEYADTINSVTGEHERIERAEALFAYRTSVFKQHKKYVIARVALRLSRRASPNVSYPDLAQARDSGEQLTTPKEIAKAVRAIRAQKFPQSIEGGTAGSFFKNPIISNEHADSLTRRFPGLPVFPQGDTKTKVSLAWLLDHALSLKGYAMGRARLYERQPLVIVAGTGASATEVDALARDVAERIFKSTNIILEREVETFGEKIFS